jgi:hypothetical protein
LNIALTAPSFNCPDNLKATAGADNNVNFDLNGIAGCDDSDCSYRISGTGADGISHSGCTNTNCKIHSVTNKSKAKGDTAIYTISLTNNEGTTTHNCRIEFIEGATCTTLGDQIIPTTNDNIHLNIRELTNGCYSIKTGKGCKKAMVQSNESVGSGTFKINGTSFDCGVYKENNITQSDVVKIEMPSTCTLNGNIYFSNCYKMIDPNNLEITNEAAMIDAGSYTVKSVACTIVRFNCPSDKNCSVGVNSSTPVEGAAYGSNIIVTPKPKANDVLHITGTAQIFCTDWQ